MLAQIQAMFAVVDLGKINWNQFLEKYLEINSTRPKISEVLMILISNDTTKKDIEE